LDVHVVCFAGSGEGAGAAKGPRPLEVGGLIARFALYRDLLRSIIHGARDWPGHWHARSVKLTLDGDPLELTGAPSALQDPLVEL
jgi:hypothetical protein